MTRIGLNLLSLVPGDIGGGQTFIESLVYGLSKQNHDDIDIVVFLNRESKDELGLPASFEIVHTSVPASNRPARYFWEQAILPIISKKHSIDVLFSPGNVSPLFCPVNTVVTIHDQNYVAVPHTMSTLKRLFLSCIVPFSAHAADHIVTISEFSKREILSNINVRDDKVSVVHNPLPPTLPNTGPLDDLDLDLSKPYIMTAGRNYPHKNLANFIAAAKNIPDDISLVLTGFECNPGDELWVLADDLGVSDRIHFCGYVPWEDMGTIYENSEVYVHPSKYEGFGFPLLEAMYYGTPVAASSAAAIPEVAGDAAVYFDPESPTDLANTVVELLENDDLRQSLKKKGEERINESSADEFATRIIKVCENIER